MDENCQENALYGQKESREMGECLHVRDKRMDSYLYFTYITQI